MEAFPTTITAVLWDKEVTLIAAQRKANSLGGFGYLSGFRNLKFSI